MRIDDRVCRLATWSLTRKVDRLRNQSYDLENFKNPNIEGMYMSKDDVYRYIYLKHRGYVDDNI